MTMTANIPLAEALARYRPDADLGPLPELTGIDALLNTYHPDHLQGSVVKLTVGANAGDDCQRGLAELLQTEAFIDEADLAGTPVTDIDVLVIGGGGAGCAAALAAAENGARVLLATKLRLGDSNTVMAEGGIQAAIEPDDSIQRHIQDTLRGGHHAGNPALVAAMAGDGPEVLRWLIDQGMQFEQTPSGDLHTRRAGGMSTARLVHCRDYTGLEMMRVLREAVIQHRSIEVWEQSPAVELLSNETGQKCVGAVLTSLLDGQVRIVRTRSVILATGGLGRLHLNGFPTSNHLGATGDGLVLAYRIGARPCALRALCWSTVSATASSTNSSRATWCAPRSCANAAKGAASASTSGTPAYGSIRRAWSAASRACWSGNFPTSWHAPMSLA